MLHSHLHPEFKPKARRLSRNSLFKRLTHINKAHLPCKPKSTICYDPIFIRLQPCTLPRRTLCFNLRCDEMLLPVTIISQSLQSEGVTRRRVIRLQRGDCSLFQAYRHFVSDGVGAEFWRETARHFLTCCPLLFPSPNVNITFEHSLPLFIFALPDFYVMHLISIAWQDL